MLHFPFKLLKITVSLHSFYFYCYCIQCWKLLELYCVWHNRGWKKKKILFLKDLRGFSRDYDNYSNRKRMILRVLFHSDRGKTIYWNVMEISDSFALRRKKYSVWNIIIANCWRDKFMEWNEKWFMLGFIERKCFKKKFWRMVKKLWTYSFRRKYISKSNTIFSWI